MMETDKKSIGFKKVSKYPEKVEKQFTEIKDLYFAMIDKIPDPKSSAKTQEKYLQVMKKFNEAFSELEKYLKDKSVQDCV